MPGNGHCRGRLLAAALSVIVLAGCMTPQALDLRERPPLSRELTEVPFFPQREFQCGPATLAMVSTYLGSPVTPDELAPSLYTPGREGSLAAEMIARARLRGFLPVILFAVAFLALSLKSCWSFFWRFMSFYPGYSGSG